MNLDSYTKSFSTGLFSPKESRKDLLWNVVEPGDPYDIRKSTIARLPHDQNNFMGENLELVCLFQAAQIERLTDNLDDYRLKYKQVQKKQLDRHSYEVQIKELVNGVAEGEQLKINVEKLKNFIRKQTMELEDWKRKASEMDENLQSKYHKALKQIEILHKDNVELKSQTNKLKNDIITWRNRMEALERSKDREMEDLRMTMQTRRRSQIDRELRQLQCKFQNERTQFQFEIRRLKDNLDRKGRDEEEMNLRIFQMGQKLSDLGDMEKKYLDSQNKILLATHEIEHLNRVMKQKNNELSNFNYQVQEYELKFPQMEEQLKRTKRKLDSEMTEKNEMERKGEEMIRQIMEMKDVGRKINQCEERMERISQEKQRTDHLLKSKVNENIEADRIINQLRYELETQKRKISSLQARTSEMNDLSEKLFQYQTKISQLNIKIEGCNRQIEKGEELQRENDFQRKKIFELSEAVGKLNEYEYNFQIASKENERLNNNLENKNKQIRQLLAKNSEAEQLARQFQHLNEQFRKITGENKDLYEEVKIGQEKLRISTSNSNKLAQEVNEIKERISLNNLENEDLKKKIKKLQQENGFLGEENKTFQENLRLSNAQQQKVLADVNEFRDRIEQNQKENQTLKRRIQNILQENQNLSEQVKSAQENLRLSASQISKLTNEVNEYRARMESNGEEVTVQKKKIQKLSSENTNLENQMRNTQENLRLSANQVIKLNNELQSANNENGQLLKRMKELGDVNRKATEYENRVALLSQEVQRLNILIENKNYEIGQMKKQLDEFEGMNITINSLQDRISKLVNENVGMENQIKDAQETIRISASQNQKIGRELADYKERLAANEQESENLKKKIQKTLQQHSSLDGEIRNSQESLRLSNAEKSKALYQLNQSRNRIDQIERQNEMIKKKMQAIIQQNQHLNEEVKNSQQNLRLSANQISKLNHDLTDYKTRLENNVEETETYRRKIQKLSSQCSNYEDEIREKQENLRISSSQIAKLNNELKALCRDNEDLELKLRDLAQTSRRLAESEKKNSYLSQELDNLNSAFQKKKNEIAMLHKKMTQIDRLNTTIGSLQQKITRLVNENTSMEDEARATQENLRYSTSQNQKIMKELNEYKKRIEENNRENDSLKQKIQKLSSENTNLNEEMKDAQESLRLSAGQQQKLNKQLFQIKSRLSQEEETNKQKVKKLSMENASLSDEVYSAQENVRLSANTITKLNSQLKNLYSENEELRARVQENGGMRRKLSELTGSVKTFEEEIDRLNAVIEKKNLEIGHCSGRLSEAETQSEKFRGRVQDLINQNNFLNDELRKAQNNLRFVNNELERLKSGQTEHEGTKRKLQQYERKQRLFQSRMAELGYEFEKLEVIIQDLRRQNQMLKQSNYEMEEQIHQFNSTYSEEKLNVLNQEVNRLSLLTEEKEGDLNELKLRFSDESSLLKRIQEHLSLFVILFAEIQSLRKRVKDKEKQVENVRRSSLAPYRN